MFRIKLDTDNQAFRQESFNGEFDFPQEGQEVARILRDLADKLEHLDKLQECRLPLRDINGNTVGYCKTWSDQGDQAKRQVSSPYSPWKEIQDVINNAND